MSNIILNLGCGTRTSSFSGVVNVDWSLYLWLRQSRVFSRFAPLCLSPARLQRFRSLSGHLLVHDLSKGIPFADCSVSAVYHSHVLEHFDRDEACGFLEDIWRVLKPGGIHRVVVPDLEILCRNYLDHLNVSSRDAVEAKTHDSYIAALYEQSVRREAYGSSQQPPVRRFIEGIFVGDARRRGETHQWMYDQVSIREKLLSAGFKSANLQSYNTSLIDGWNEIGLDLNENGEQYKPDSLYIEAIK